MRTFNGTIIGNIENKADLRNPIARALVARFDRELSRLVALAAPTSIHEVGCGEGRLTTLLATSTRVPFRASDLTATLFSPQSPALENVTFVERSVYELEVDLDSADLVVCCEVLEHLERPDEALERLRGLAARRYLFSVPREPLWRFLNMARGRYLLRGGNTPGHLNHWSSRGFLALLRGHGFCALSVSRPLPWTMVLAHLERSAGEPDRAR